MISPTIGVLGLPFLVKQGMLKMLSQEQLDVISLPDQRSLTTSDTPLQLLVLGASGQSPEDIYRYLQAHSSIVLLVLLDDAAFDFKKLTALGVKAIVNWDCPEEEIATALHMAIKGKKYICDRLLDRMLVSDHSEANTVTSELSSREKEVLHRIAYGLTTHEVADELHLSMHTVNSHRKNIMKKLDLKYPSQLIAFAWQHGLVK